MAFALSLVWLITAGLLARDRSTTDDATRILRSRLVRRDHPSRVRAGTAPDQNRKLSPRQEPRLEERDVGAPLREQPCCQRALPRSRRPATRSSSCPQDAREGWPFRRPAESRPVVVRHGLSSGHTIDTRKSRPSQRSASGHQNVKSTPEPCRSESVSGRSATHTPRPVALASRSAQLPPESTE